MGGLPGSGKSTMVKKYWPDLPVVSADENRLRLTGDTSNFTREAEVWNLVHQQVAYYMRTEQSFVYDATNSYGPLRRKMLNFMWSLYRSPRQVPAMMGVFLDVSASTAKARNAQRDRKVPEKVIDRMQKQFFADPPTMEEGFHTLDFLGAVKRG